MTDINNEDLEKVSGGNMENLPRIAMQRHIYTFKCNDTNCKGEIIDDKNVGCHMTANFYDRKCPTCGKNMKCVSHETVAIDTPKDCT